MQQEMISLAMQSSKADMISAAEYCEEQHMIEKAVALYHKGGRVSKALELCFQHNLFQALAEISEGLDQDADPAILQRAADFFMENNQQDKAVGLLIMSRRFEEALDMCANYDVIITEDYAERMTVPKGEMDSKARNALLERMGDICHSQGQYQLATRKYTQAGKLVKAMRALLKGASARCGSCIVLCRLVRGRAGSPLSSLRVAAHARALLVQGVTRRRSSTSPRSAASRRCTSWRPTTCRALTGGKTPIS